MKKNLKKVRIEFFENNPNWIRSIGEKLDKIHFRNGHLHAECDPKTGYCKIHYDKYDPYKSLDSLVRHVAASNSGKLLIMGGCIAVIDQIFTGGQLRNSIMKML